MRESQKMFNLWFLYQIAYYFTFFKAHTSLNHLDYTFTQLRLAAERLLKNAARLRIMHATSHQAQSSKVQSNNAIAPIKNN